MKNSERMFLVVVMLGVMMLSILAAIATSYGQAPKDSPRPPAPSEPPTNVKRLGKQFERYYHFWRQNALETFREQDRAKAGELIASPAEFDPYDLPGLFSVKYQGGFYMILRDERWHRLRDEKWHLVTDEKVLRYLGGHPKYPDHWRGLREAFIDGKRYRLIQGKWMERYWKQISPSLYEGRWRKVSDEKALLKLRTSRYDY